MPNINTESYWDNRFASGDWEGCNGRSQTTEFAKAQMRWLPLPASNFAGSILDFGCGLGDAIPVYRERFPRARLMGVDISSSAIAQCREKFGNIATFYQGTHAAVPSTDIIIASNVLEHLSDHLTVARHLLGRCRQLHIIVPYQEREPLHPEHVNRYAAFTFQDVGPCQTRIFTCRAWTYTGSYVTFFYQYRLKNIGRLVLGRPVAVAPRQIAFTFGSA